MATFDPMKPDPVAPHRSPRNEVWANRLGWVVLALALTGWALPDQYRVVLWPLAGLSVVLGVLAVGLVLYPRLRRRDSGGEPTP